jgi:hypothetical protein
MTDNFIDDEAQEFLGKVGIKFGITRQLPEPFNLFFFTRRIGWWQAGGRLIFPHCLRYLKALGEHENQSCINIVDAAAISRKGSVFTHETALPRHFIRNKGFCTFCTCQLELALPLNIL